MDQIILNGKSVAISERKKLALEVSTFSSSPKLVIILVGNNAASEIYVKNKLKACEEVGVKSLLISLPESIGEDELLKTISELNSDDSVDGVIVQLPLPRHIDENKVIEAIDERKDVDGFGIKNKGKLLNGIPSLVAATPLGIMTLLEHYNIPLTGLHAVVVGRSNIVGKPIALLLLQANCTVTIAHTRTKDLPSITRQADLLIVAAGRANLVSKEMVKPGCIIVDVGMNRVDGVLCGDCATEAYEAASYYTPVPGGVGPMTIVSLLRNTIEAHKRKGI